MKTLLINPPVPEQKNWVREGRCQQMDIWGSPFPPLSLALIAGQIKDISETLIIDSGPAGLGLKETLKMIGEFNPDLLIIAAATPTIDTDLNWFLPKVKELNSRLKAAVIGIHATELPEKTMADYPCLDFIIKGEPELIAKDLTLSLKNKNFNFNQILGLVFRQDGKIISNRARDFILNLDQLADPVWPGVDFNNYKLPILNKPFNLITFARGCPFNCNFCNAAVYYGKKVRKRSPARIIREIEFNVKNYGIKDFLFWTEFVTVDQGYLREVLSLLKESGLAQKIRWVSNSRASGVDPSLFKEMKETGCWQIAFGLEFGSDKILGLANKGPGASLAEHSKIVAAAAAAGIVLDGHFILGYPGEDEKNLQQTVDFACRLPLTFAHFYIATPFPGSQLYREAVENNLISQSAWRMISQDAPYIKTAELAPDTVKKYVSRAYRKFYLRPKAIWRIIKIANNPAELFSVFQTGIKFIASII